MEHNFDKEMDTLLRQAARSGQVVSTNDFDSHLDADEISMFAENALPEKAKARATKHLAECNNCRSILSDLILLNEETEIEAVSSAVEEKTVVVPWYKKLFVFPQIAYAMGALALVFSGFIGLLIYQTANQTASFDMAKSEPNMTANKAASGPNAGDYAPELNESQSNTMSANANVAANTSTETDSDIAKTANANSFTPNAPSAKIPSAEKSGRDEDAIKENESDGVLKPQPVERKDRAAGSKEMTRMDDAPMPEATPATAPPPAPPVNPTTTRNKKQADKKKDAESAKLSTGAETRQQVGGKTFNRVNGVWIDNDYRQMGNLQLPMTTTIRRGSDQYKKLDRNIRTIAESLDGPVIIVSGSKAYRIQ